VSVEFFFAPASRYSYLAATQIAELERETNCSVRRRPVHGPDIRRLRGRLVELAHAHGLDRDRFSTALVSKEVSDELARTAREAFSRGAFGVPTFFVSERMFWGNDRLALVRHALETHPGTGR